MFATRCKLRWPGPSTSRARPTLPRAPGGRRLGTTASSEAGRDDKADEGDTGDGSTRKRIPYRQPRAHVFVPFAYEPMPLSYADILSRAISTPVTDAGRVLNQISRALQSSLRRPPHHSHTEDAPVRPEDSSPPLGHVLDRSLKYLTTQTARIEAALSAVTKDISSDAVPKACDHDFAAIRNHHLGRWYAKTLAFKTEHLHINFYLNNVAFATEKARNLIIRCYLQSVEQSLHVQKAVVRRAIRQHGRDLEAVVYAMACGLREARRAQQWHEVWALERRLASTATMFLPPQPLSSVCHLLLNRDDERMTEVSMSRLAEWNDSYQQLYEEDVRIRKKMNLVKRYWIVFNSSVHEKPWQGDADFFEARSPTTKAREFIVIRRDQSGPPSPLWPSIWRPIDVGREDNPARLKTSGAKHATSAGPQSNPDFKSIDTSPGAKSTSGRQFTPHYHFIDWQQPPPTPLTTEMSSITNQSTKKLEQGTNAALPNAEFSSAVFELGSQPNEGLQDLSKEVKNTPGAGRSAPGASPRYAGGGSIWSNEIKPHSPGAATQEGKDL